jgi:hypothetical protein
MAGIDYSIPGQIRPIQVESPMNAMAQAMQLRGLQESSQMNALRMQEQALKTKETQETSRQRNALAAYLANPKKPTDPLELEAGVRQVAPLLADKFVDDQLKREELGVRTAERQAKTEELGLKKEERERALSKEKIETAIADITSFDKLDDIRMDIGRKIASGELKQEDADRVMAGLPFNNDDVPAWQIRTVRSLLSAKDRLADVRAAKKDVFEEKRLGFEEKRLGFEETRVANEAERLKLEDARVQETQRHQRAMENISGTQAERQEKQLQETERHNKAMERLRRAEINKPSAIAAPTVTMVLDPNDNTRMLSVDAKTYRGGTLGSQGVIGIAGKEPTVGKKQEAKETAQENASNTIAVLRQSFDQLDKLGGITSTQNRAGTNIMAGLSSSGLGQATGRLLGTEEQSERNKIAQTRPLLMTSIMQAMGLSAKQLDSNAELKLWLSAATDPTLDLESNRAALNNLENMLTGKGKSKPTAPDARSAPPPPSGFVPDKK